MQCIRIAYKACRLWRVLKAQPAKAQPSQHRKTKNPKIQRSKRFDPSRENFSKAFPRTTKLFLFDPPQNFFLETFLTSFGLTWKLLFDPWIPGWLLIKNFISIRPVGVALRTTLVQGLHRVYLFILLALALRCVWPGWYSEYKYPTPLYNSASAPC